MHGDAMTLQQKRVYRDGYVILKNVVPQAMVDAAHARIESRKHGENIAKAREMTDLVNATAVTPVLNDAMGRFDPPIASQVAVIPTSKPRGNFNNVGYVDRQVDRKRSRSTVFRAIAYTQSRCRGAFGLRRQSSTRTRRTR